MKIVFADTNKLFGLLRAMVMHSSDLSSSMFVQYSKTHTVYVSTFVLTELLHIAQRNNIVANESHIKVFVNMAWLKVYESSYVWAEYYTQYVFDNDDAQLVQDAVEIGATHLLTNNTKDFKISSIVQELHLQIISNLDDILE